VLIVVKNTFVYFVLYDGAAILGSRQVLRCRIC